MIDTVIKDIEAFIISGAAERSAEIKVLFKYDKPKECRSILL